MIFKSYIIEENFALISKNFILFYGENIGLLNSFKNKIKSNLIKEEYQMTRILKKYQI